MDQLVAETQKGSEMEAVALPSQLSWDSWVCAGGQVQTSSTWKRDSSRNSHTPPAD